MRRTIGVGLGILLMACGNAAQDEALLQAQEREVEARQAAIAQAQAQEETARAAAVAAQRPEEIVGPGGERTLVIHDMPTEQPMAEVRAGGGIVLQVMGVTLPDGSAIFHRDGDTTWVATPLDAQALVDAISPQLRGRSVGLDVGLANDPEVPAPIAPPDWAVTVAHFYPMSERPAAPEGVPSVEYRPDPATGAPIAR